MATRMIDGARFAVRPTNGGPGWTVQRLYRDLGGLWYDASDPGTYDECVDKLTRMAEEAQR